MRYYEIHEGYDDLTRLPRPAYVVAFRDEEDGDEYIAHVFVNPSPELLKRIIGQFDCRALIAENGRLYVWPESNCYHRDVSEGLQKLGVDLGNVEYLMLQSPMKQLDVYVSIKDVEVGEVANKALLQRLRDNRSLRGLYGDDFAVDHDNWW